MMNWLKASSGDRKSHTITLAFACCPEGVALVLRLYEKHAEK